MAQSNDANTQSLADMDGLLVLYSSHSEAMSYVLEHEVRYTVKYAAYKVSKGYTEAIGR